MITTKLDIIIEKLALEGRGRISDVFQPIFSPTELFYLKGYLLALADIQKSVSGNISKRLKIMLNLDPQFRDHRVIWRIPLIERPKLSPQNSPDPDSE